MGQEFKSSSVGVLAQGQNVGWDLSRAEGLASKMAHSLGWQVGAVGKRPAHMDFTTWTCP